MKYFKLFIFFFLVGLVASLTYFIFARNKNQAINIHSPISSTPNFNFSIGQPPKDSVKGIIASMSGNIMWQSRLATEPAQIAKPQTIQQGESLVTGDTGNVSLSFPNFANLTIFPKSELNIIQTLPINFVFEQTTGSVTYEETGSTPVSIRTLNLITKLDSAGALTVIIDKDKGRVTATEKAGSATVAYNDLQFVSQVVALKAGQVLVFDEATRTTSVK